MKHKRYIAKTKHRVECYLCGERILIGHAVATWAYSGEYPGDGNIMRVHAQCYDVAKDMEFFEDGGWPHDPLNPLTHDYITREASRALHRRIADERECPLCCQNIEDGVTPDEGDELSESEGRALTNMETPS